MRTRFMCLTMALLTLAVSAKTETPRKRLSPEERQKQLLEKVGGIIVVPPQGEVAIFNAQTKLAAEVVALRAKFFTKMLDVPVNVRPCDSFAIATAEATMSAAKANVGVFLVDMPDMPMSLVALEGPWAMINMAKLAEGEPSADVLKQRYNAELNRVMTSLLGTGAPGRGLGPRLRNNEPPKSPKTAADLDSASNIAISQESLFAIVHNLDGWGVRPERKSTYKRAYQLGWAPPPTNEYQRAVIEREQQKKKDAQDSTARWKRDFPDKAKQK